VSGDRLQTAWTLAVIVACLAAIVVWVRVSARKAAVVPREAPAEEEDEPVCRSRGCAAPATRGLPEARPWRPVSWLLPRWEVVTDPDGDVAVCAAHHGPLAAALTARAAQERAALEEHLAARHRDLVAWALSQLTRDHGIAAAPARPSPLRGSTLAPSTPPPPDALDGCGG
jgi:hypothetical protein